jgi:hypothetical protein
LGGAYDPPERPARQEWPEADKPPSTWRSAPL